MKRAAILAISAFLIAGALLAPAAFAKKKRVPLPRPLGPCTKAAAQSMPDDPGHDHLDISQHEFSCGFEEVFFDGLADELAAQPDVMLGEIDIESDLLAIGVAFPESGVLFYDVSDPANPEFLSWYRGSQCEALYVDIDCGAYVDLSEDGQVAFLSVQSLTVAPSSAADPGVRPLSGPGVEVIDVSDPTLPIPTQFLPVPSQGGVHASRSHIIPENPEDSGPRMPGEYLFSIANFTGLQISLVERTGVPKLVPVSFIQMEDTHDMFLQDDPLTGRTYMYVAAGFESGFYVFDVTDPTDPVLLAEWDITPQCSGDWYAHTVDVATRGDRRYVTVDAEIFDGGAVTGPPECGTINGSADRPGPLWIVDATDLSRIGPANTGTDAVPTLAENSAQALVTTWTNPASRPGGYLLFSTHNQQIVGKRIYLSNYHGGVYILDASGAFAGREERPRELAFVVPHGSETRPFVELNPPPQSRFITLFQARPSVWDTMFYKGYVIAVDMYGGLYSYRYNPKLT